MKKALKSQKFIILEKFQRFSIQALGETSTWKRWFLFRSLPTLYWRPFHIKQENIYNMRKHYMANSTLYAFSIWEIYLHLQFARRLDPKTPWISEDIKLTKPIKMTSLFIFSLSENKLQKCVLWTWMGGVGEHWAHWAMALLSDVVQSPLLALQQRLHGTKVHCIAHGTQKENEK